MSALISRLFSLLTLRDHQDMMRGLANYRLSCCVNTLLQTLSATWEVTDLLDRWEPAGASSDGWNVALQLKRVLAAMRSNLPQHVAHRDFLHCLDRNCVRLFVQHDADEVFLSILNFIQQHMDNKALALEIQNLYKISVETHLQCLECSWVQTKTDSLLSLPLHLQEDHDSLEGCISSFLDDQELTGRNCCFCARCGNKTPSKRSLRLRSLPPILCVHLKRFRNTRGYTRKLDCRVTFPETFDLSQIAAGRFSTDFTQNQVNYTLFAVVVHSGQASFGHFTAYVRDRVNKRWYYADDSNIEQVSWEDVQSTYGRYYGGTAYMLMYRDRPHDEGPRSEQSS